MTDMPWFAWLGIVAIVVWGLVMIFGKSAALTNRHKAEEEQRHEIQNLKRRIEDLEAQANRHNQ
ncbi:MAG TPA: hypothetical protein H9884_02595 [Candidatus Yaniella excrementigallinarum]|nr:hypothetical protein [Candidatus Yaniella excrementigallinarum]